MAQISQINPHQDWFGCEWPQRMGTRPGRRVCAFWGARMGRPGLTSGNAGSRRRRAHAGWVGAHGDAPRFLPKSPNRWPIPFPTETSPSQLSSAPRLSSALKNAFALILVHPSYPRQKAFLVIGLAPPNRTFKDLHEGHEELPKRARRQAVAPTGPPGLRAPVACAWPWGGAGCIRVLPEPAGRLRVLCGALFWRRQADNQKIIYWV